MARTYKRLGSVASGTADTFFTLVDAGGTNKNLINCIVLCNRTPQEGSAATIGVSLMVSDSASSCGYDDYLFDNIKIEAGKSVILNLGLILNAADRYLIGKCNVADGLSANSYGVILS